MLEFIWKVNVRDSFYCCISCPIVTDLSHLTINLLAVTQLSKNGENFSFSNDRSYCTPLKTGVAPIDENMIESRLRWLSCSEERD